MGRNHMVIGGEDVYLSDVMPDPSPCKECGEYFNDEQLKYGYCDDCKGAVCKGCDYEGTRDEMNEDGICGECEDELEQVFTKPLTELPLMMNWMESHAAIYVAKIRLEEGV